MEKIARSLLEVFFHKWLRECFQELKRDIGPICKENGLDIKEATPLIFELMTNSLELFKKEVQKELEKTEKKS